jgi:hypothetical protein
MSLKNRFVTAVALVMLVFPIGVKAQDKQNCSNTTLHGSYGLHATGTIIGVGNFAAVGRFTFDGKGNLTATLFVRVNGNNNQVTLKGTYSVSSDCTVSDTWHLSDGSTSTHESVIVNEGQEYFILNNTSGEPSVISGEAKKQ